MSDVLTVSEAAEYLGVHPETVYRMARNRELPVIKLGRGPRAPIRLRRSAIDGWLDVRTIPARQKPGRKPGVEAASTRP